MRRAGANASARRGAGRRRRVSAPARYPTSAAHSRHSPWTRGSTASARARSRGDRAHSRHMPSGELSSPVSARHEEQRRMYDNAGRGAWERARARGGAAGRVDRSGGARDTSGSRAARPRATTSGSTRRGDGGRRAGDDERDPAFAEATTTSTCRPGPLRRALANVVITCSYIPHTS